MVHIPFPDPKSKNRCCDLEKRYRNYQFIVRVTDEEKKQIDERMQLCGSINRNAFIRKMALDGYIINLKIPELKEILSLLRYTSNNINQIAAKVNATGIIYKNEIAEIKKSQTELWSMLDKIIAKFSKLK